MAVTFWWKIHSVKHPATLRGATHIHEPVSNTKQNHEPSSQDLKEKNSRDIITILVQSVVMVVDASVSDEAEAGFDGVRVVGSVVDSGDSAGVGDLAVSVLWLVHQSDINSSYFKRVKMEEILTKNVGITE